MPSTPNIGTRISHITDKIEEAVIAGLLGLMTLLTFANVIARYVFNSNILWATEATTFLFAWLVLLGMSYCVKKNTHLGVDIGVNAVPQEARFPVTLMASAAAITYAVLLTIGAWAFWLPFFTERTWYQTDDLPVPAFIQVFGPMLNDGEPWDKLPRFIPYVALPIGTTLLTVRFIQATLRIINGEQDLLIASHGEDAPSGTDAILQTKKDT